MTPDDYQQARRELARTVAMPEDVAARLERDLERAFEANLAAVPVRHGRAGSLDPAKILAAAAALIVAVGTGFWYVRHHTVTPNNVTARVEQKVHVGDEVHLKVDSTDRKGTDRKVSDRDVRLQADRVRPKKLPPVIQPAGFVPVPAAAGLPQFESGVIVRVSLPVAALPSYGVDISPASSGDSVEADVLVAQDGVARAIRLVNTLRSQQ